MFRFSRLFWIALLACAFVALGDDRAEAETVLASWYGPGFEGSPTASGEPFDPYAYTAAHKTLPFGTELVVGYGGRSVRVTVNDRGPYVAGRELDLSQAAAEDLGLTMAGTDYVDYAVVGDAGTPAYPEPERAAAPDYGASTPSGGEYAQPQADGGGSYVLQPGDTLSEIAPQLGTTVGTLAAANGIADPDVVYAGQTIHY